ncbi:Geranylgeranylglyceryl phosphate synthase [Candidatus Methanoperedenaceae archaeon GB37]|nr:Geranylgeranylglyceryl phosphate synthase [Candidatus Methanoperedenaceae archaeon GB37]
MSVEERLDEIVKATGAAFLVLLDPEAQEPMVAGKMAEDAAAAGADGIMVGGSTGVGGGVLDETVQSVKRSCSLPVILFPSNVGGLSKYADAVFFMSLLNSRDPNYITTNQALGALIVKRYGIEPIPMAYILIEPGGTVGWVGDARLIPRDRPQLAVAYALAGKYLGMRYLYLEAGSGAERHVPLEMITSVKEAIGRDCKLIVGGGIRDGESAGKIVEAGADIIVTGTAVEERRDVREKVKEITERIKTKK